MILRAHVDGYHFCSAERGQGAIAYEAWERYDYLVARTNKGTHGKINGFAASDGNENFPARMIG